MSDFLSKNKLLVLLLAVLIVLAVGMFVALRLQSAGTTPPELGVDGTEDKLQNQEPQGDETLPPSELTWEYYASLPPEEQALFPDNFESMDDFYDWFDKEKPTEAVTENTDPTEPPPTVDLNGKDPEDFTWEDYLAMPLQEQALFPDYFESMDAFYAWYNRVNPHGGDSDTEAMPTEEPGEIKNPEQYTWEEYKALPPEQQMFFPDYFESYDAFKLWWERECPEKP